jgi:transcriptional regulator with XRE-family HTH domain
MNHWTQESVKDFAYHLALDFFTQLEDRFEDSELLRKEFAKKVSLTPGRISQIFNDPPANPKVDTLVKYAQALGLKVSIVAYDDNDPTNEKGPIFSGVIAKCWENQGKPRDFFAFVPNAHSDTQALNWFDMESFNDLGSQKKKPQSVQEDMNSGSSNEAAGQ